MEAAVNYSRDEIVRTEIRSFINEGLQDVCHNRLLDPDVVFDQLEERYHANE